MMVRNGALITPPHREHPRRHYGAPSCSLRRRARSAAIERPIDRSELYLADEAFFCGTGAQVTPIAEVDHRPRQRRGRAHHTTGARLLQHRLRTAARFGHWGPLFTSSRWQLTKSDSLEQLLPRTNAMSNGRSKNDLAK